jgi:hypothetical protein
VKPFWNILALAGPLTVAALGAILTVTSRSGTGDFAGRLGNGVLFVLAVGATCLVGEVAAVVSLVRGERHAWLAILGLILNLIIISPIAAILMSD